MSLNGGLSKCPVENLIRVLSSRESHEGGGSQERLWSLGLPGRETTPERGASTLRRWRVRSPQEQVSGSSAAGTKTETQFLSSGKSLGPSTTRAHTP